MAVATWRQTWRWRNGSNGQARGNLVVSCSSGSRPGLLAGVCLAVLAPLSVACAQSTLVGVSDAPVATTATTTPQLAQANGVTPGTSRLSEVIVTAGRRATDIQKTPTAVSTVSAGALDASFITNLTGLNGIVPSLEITHQSGFENDVTIRGVGYATPENSPTNVPGVAEFVDGVYIANTISLDETLFDIDHIEVLRGPQGALYGQSADGGAISILTTQPKLRQYDGSGDFSAGDYALFRERAEVNVPIGDTVAVRVSAQAYDHDGFTRNLAIPQNRLDDAHDMSGKIAVLWRPNTQFSATLTGQVYHSDQNGAAQKNVIENTLPGLEDPRVVYQDYPATFDLTTQLYHLNLEYDTPYFIVKSVTAYQQLDHVQQEDGSRSAFSVVGFYDDVAGWNTHLENYTEEFDLLSRPGSRFEWTVGAFALAQKTRQTVVEYEGFGTPPPADLSIHPDVMTNPPANTGFGQLEDVNRQSYSGFGQATYHLLPTLRITSGVRVNHDAYTPATFGFSAPAFGGPASPPLHQDSPAYSDTVPTFKVEADYDLTPQNLIYGSVARGYKPGGVNANIGAVVVPQTFQYETNTSYEVGSKSSFMDRTVRVNLAAFYYDYDNFQYLEVDPNPFHYGTANVPSLHIYGVEAETSYVSPDNRLHINFNAALENGFVQGGYTSIDASIASGISSTNQFCTEFNGAGKFFDARCFAAIQAAAEPLRGKTPPDMPKISGSVNASYAFATPFGTLTPRAEYIYRGSEWARIFNDRALDRVSPYGVTNFNLDFRPTGSKLRLSLAATNAFDVNGVNSKYTDPFGTGQTSQQYIPPRQIIGTVAFAF